MSDKLGAQQEDMMASNSQSAQSAQLPQPSTFTFALQQFPIQQQQQQQQREVKKNFVFVDEHNRHKRLKVMRACEGCRRRKIKCDAATTNTWPCSACIRLKLTCVRPNGYDDNGTTLYEASPSDIISPISMQGGFPQHPQSHHPHLSPLSPQSMASISSAGAGVFHAPQGLMGSFQVSVYSDSYPNSYPDSSFPDSYPNSYPDPSQAQHQHQHMHYAAIPQNMTMPPISALDQQFATQTSFPTPPLHQTSQLSPHAHAHAHAPVQAQTPQDAASPASSLSQDLGQQDLVELLGSLNVNETGTAPYLRNKASFRREEPAVEDDDEYEPPPMPISRGPGSRIRIPPDLMPDDATALRYFDAFFKHVHQYIPVLSSTLFYRQWHTDRGSVSPLILEALFAIGGRLLDEPAQGQQWLALASMHADSFMDTPRLSTLQALLLILKAREAAPKRGYYYRSWMTVVQCVQMGKDLALDEHLADHEAGRSCDSDLLECRMKTRIWQAIFACETMTGAPQGRMDFSVGLDTVDFGLPETVGLPGEDLDVVISRNFTYLVRVIRNVGKMSSVYTRVKKKPDWGLDPDFAQLNPMCDSWLTELPPDLSVEFPPDGTSPPVLPSSFHGNAMSYYYLTLVLVHRPQLAFLDGATTKAEWKAHMLICNRSAKLICRLQEAIINTFGLLGLQSMLRGYSFSVYAGLSCIVLHLVSMTSPDADLHTDSSEYFTRHMRIIEQIMEVWPMPELQRQVDTLREAFSADLSRPFTLKTTFPYSSPRPSHDSASPPVSATAHCPPAPVPPQGALQRSTSMDQQIYLTTMSGAYGSGSRSGSGCRSVTPPVSAGSVDPADSLVMMAQPGQPSVMSSSLPLPEQPSWNPTPLLTQWNTTFGPQPSQQTMPGFSPTMSANSSSPQTTHRDPRTVGDMHAGEVMGSGPVQMPPQNYVPPPQPFITPAMWQQSVGAIYVSGMKRTWNDYKGGAGPRRVKNE